MKLIVFTDVHGNLPALRAATDAMRREGYDGAVHLGDAIGIGPYPAECLHELLALPDVRCIMGNHDDWFARGLPDPRPAWMSAGEVTHHRWTHRQLSPDLRAVVALWPRVLRYEFDAVSMTFLHYALDPAGREFAPILRDPSISDLERLFAPYASALVFYGHHHPFSDATGTARYINPGSLGCHDEPVARYTVVACRQGAVTVEHRRIPYDDSALVSAFEQRQVPERSFLYKAFFGNRFRQWDD